MIKYLFLSFLVVGLLLAPSIVKAELLVYLPLNDGSGDVAKAAVGPDGILGNKDGANPIWVDVDGNGFKPHSPIDDQVYAYLDVLKPLMTKPGSGPARVRLYLKNLGKVEAADTLSVEILPEGSARMAGPQCEVTEAGAHGRGAQSLRRDRAARACEVRVDDHKRAPSGPRRWSAALSGGTGALVRSFTGRRLRSAPNGHARPRFRATTAPAPSGRGAPD